VADRLVALEHPMPDRNKLLVVDEDRALCKASVRLPTGGTATAHASATVPAGLARWNWPSRARSAGAGRMGYGAEYSGKTLSRDGRPSPVSLVPPPSPVRPFRERAAQIEPAPEALPTPRLNTPNAHRARAARGRVRSARTDGATAPAVERVEPRTARGLSCRQTPPAARVDVSWTRWEWAKDRVPAGLI
jgi:hypothetical protein